jgi:Rrf2 family protein
MLQLTKRTEYGLIALVHLADREGEYVSVREIAERYPIPRRLLAEVLKDLCRGSIVESQRGSSGGYALARRPEDVTLGQVVTALEGAPPLTSCETPAVIKQGGCEVEPTCPIRSPIHRVRERLWQLFEHTTLRSLVSSPPQPIEILAGSHAGARHSTA